MILGDKEGRRYERCKTEDVCNSKKTVLSRILHLPSTTHTPFSVCVYVYSACQLGGLFTEIGAPLYPSCRPPSPPGQILRNLASSLLNRALARFKLRCPLPLDSVNPEFDVTRTEIWIIGARPSVPRLTQGSNLSRPGLAHAITSLTPC